LAVDTAARARNIRITRDELIVELQDGRTVSVPLAWFPKLLHATNGQRRKWELLGDGEGIRWPAVDEDRLDRPRADGDRLARVGVTTEDDLAHAPLHPGRAEV